MKRFLLLLVGCATLSCSSHHDTSLEEAIASFNSAFKDGDVEILSSSITSNYVHTNGTWKSFGKSKWLEYMEGRAEKLKNGRLLITSYSMEELAIQYHGNSALVTGKITSEGIEDGSSFHKEFRVTNLWGYHEGRWLRAGFHDCSI